MKAKFIEKDGKTVPDRDESGKAKQLDPAPGAAKETPAEKAPAVVMSSGSSVGRPTMTFAPASYVAGISDKQSFNRWLTEKIYAWNRREADALQDG